MKMKKFISLMLASAVLVLGCCACGGNKTDKEENKEENEVKNEAVQNKEDLYENKINFTIEMENGSVMSGELYPDLAPITVENFVKLAEDNFYEGLIFHRVIPGFMIQGGGFDKDYNQKPAESIKGEFKSNGVENDLKHTRGVISMARTSVPDSASSQFFIMHEDSPWLDGEYAAFGKITEGLEVLDEIANTETTSLPQYGMDDVPTQPQIIKSISINK